MGVIDQLVGLTLMPDGESVDEPSEATNAVFGEGPQADI